MYVVDACTYIYVVCTCTFVSTWYLCTCSAIATTTTSLLECICAGYLIEALKMMEICRVMPYSKEMVTKLPKQVIAILIRNHVSI